MAESTKSGSKKVQSEKIILAPPFMVEWPIIPQDYIIDVKDEMLKSTAAMKLDDVKVKWSEISNVGKDDRPAKRKELLDAHLERMTHEEREVENNKKSKWNYFIQGYNSVMRNLEKNNLSGILIKKNVVPDTLGHSFVPVCFAKNIPLIPIDDLDKLLKRDSSLGLTHSITVLGLKKTQEPDWPFADLLQKMVMAWKSKISNENTILVEENVKTVYKRSKVSVTVPKVDTNKYLLRRKNNNQRVFMPVENVQAANFISFNKSEDSNSLPSVSEVEVQENIKEDVSQMETDTARKDDIQLDLTPDFFFLDTVEEPKKKKKRNTKKREVSNVKQGIERKLTSNYIPATVMKMKPNANRKKHKK